MKQTKPSGPFEVVSRVAFGAVASVMAVFAVIMTAYGIGQTAHAFFFWQDFGQAVLKGVGYVIVSIAVFEVAKYLVEEEVMRGREMRAPSEARRSMTKFMSTIAIAVFLEGLVIVYRVSQVTVSDLVYPSLLLITGVILVLGLGVFQRLSVGVESEVEEKDKAADR